MTSDVAGFTVSKVAAGAAWPWVHVATIAPHRHPVQCRLPAPGRPPSRASKSPATRSDTVEFLPSSARQHRSASWPMISRLRSRARPGRARAPGPGVPRGRAPGVLLRRSRALPANGRADRGWLGEAIELSKRCPPSRPRSPWGRCWSARPGGSSRPVTQGNATRPTMPRRPRWPRSPRGSGGRGGSADRGSADRGSADRGSSLAGRTCWPARRCTARWSRACTVPPAAPVRRADPCGWHQAGRAGVARAAAVRPWRRRGLAARRRRRGDRVRELAAEARAVNAHLPGPAGTSG